jgi:hypothetical protein
MGFLVICFGITILQMSKVDPQKFNKLDRRSTLLLQAAQNRVGFGDEKGGLPLEEQEPGIDALRGTFGTVGSIIRARTRRMSQNSQNTTHARMRPAGAAEPYDSSSTILNIYPNADVTRHQLYDPPVPRDDTFSIRDSVLSQQYSTRRPTIKFDIQDVVHSYKRPGTGDDTATHEHRQTRGPTLHDVYPPLSISEGNDEEPNLFTTSPTMLRNSTAPQVIPKIPPPRPSQMLHIPPFIANEHTVRSAPAAIRHTRPDALPPMPMTSKGDLLFESTSGKETLLSFPSVTESAPSEWGAVGVDTEGRDAKKESSRELGNAPKVPVKSPKRYPKGSADDDEEESETLFRQETITSHGHDDNNNITSTTPPDVTGIRLVMINDREYF